MTALSRRRLTAWCCALLAAVLPWPALAAAERTVDFAEVEPIFAAHCVSCHGPAKHEAGLRLDHREPGLRGGDSGAVLVPGRADESELFQRITDPDRSRRMPPPGGQPLSAEQASLLRAWIDQGADWPDDGTRPEVRTDHWAYQPLDRREPPPVRNKGWVRSPIDNFVLAVLEEAGVSPSPEADRYTLIKRLHYDLVGLPPTPEAADAFVEDDSPDAYENLVERLLASPHFGERWGRHWLDKARYADSDGYEKDNPRPDAWRFRDWVIQAINNDLPFDRFTIEQLAGDLIPGAGWDQKIATAFHRQTLTNTEGGVDPEEFRVEAVFDRVNTTGTVWMGLTVACAQCHTHKYDQITQAEYYQLFAFFNNGDEASIDVSAGGDTMSVRVIAERTEKPRATHLLRRGDFLDPQAEVPPGALAVLPDLEPRRPGAPADRLDLAQWLVGPDNPLTPRVAVNHVWAHLFGRGIVRTLDDFGVRGERPTHPELLDWLAAEYQRLGWSRKALIRRIVNSATYRQASHHRPELAERDPRNDLFYRQNRLRVEAEIVRDLHLAAGGLLSPKVGGPSVFPPMPADVAALSYAGNFRWTTSEGEDRYRRGMYTFFKRTAPHPNLMTFDCPDSNVTAVERRTSNTPLMALTTLNNPVFVEASRAMARRLLTEPEACETRPAAGRPPPTDAARLTRAFRLCVARPPSDAELSAFLDLLAASRTWYGSHAEDAKRLIGDDRPADAAAEEAAAWTATARMIMNLDEFIMRE